MTHYTNSQRLAIVAGIAATAGAIGLLLSDAIGTGHWTLDHAITPLVVGLTVASGHLVANALRDRKIIAAIGFAMAFLVGTAVIARQWDGRCNRVVAA
jgi:uncharacterized membrane protein